MSGFVGLLSADGPVDASQLERITRYLACCGPDRQDTWCDGPVGLGHALLRTTTDSAPDHQPRTLDGRAWIVADARVDGRADLLRELREDGRHIPADAADGDLILHAYARWGEQCVQHLAGDFAFAIWDAGRRSLFCARDHFGVIPLYYAEVAGGLIVSNLVNAVRLHPAISDRFHEQAIGDFLLFNMNMDPSTTTFADIRRLPAAHTLVWCGGRMRIEAYWDPTEPRDHVRFAKPRQYVEQFGEIFEQAVRDRLRTDRAAVQLSGGMDSTSIAATAQGVFQASGRPFDLRAYTIGYQWLIKEDEGRYADAVAAHLGMPVEHLTAEDFLTRAPDPAAWVTPEPGVMADSSAEYETLKRVAAFSRVLLTGFGGDPLFGYKRSRWATSLPDRGGWTTVRQIAAAALGRNLPRLGVRSALRQRLRPRGPARTLVPTWLNRDFVRRAQLDRRVREVAEERRRASGLQSMRLVYWSNLFEWAHPGFHGVPVQVGFPFFDLRLVRYIATVPPFPWRTEKYLLRESMRGRLPELVRRRPKTPLYVRGPNVRNDDPHVRLASQPDTRRWRRDLLASTADLASFVDLDRAFDIVESPAKAGIGSGFDSCISLASWMAWYNAARIQSS